MRPEPVLFLHRFRRPPGQNRWSSILLQYRGKDLLVLPLSFSFLHLFLRLPYGLCFISCVQSCPPKDISTRIAPSCFASLVAQVWTSFVGLLPLQAEWNAPKTFLQPGSNWAVPFLLCFNLFITELAFSLAILWYASSPVSSRIQAHFLLADLFRKFRYG